jgi:hypothetical protein
MPKGKMIPGWAEVLNCKYCGKSLKKESSTQVFCDTKCQNNWYYRNDEQFRERVKKNARKSYNKYKDDPEYKKKRDLKTREWIKNNRVRFNALVLKNRKARAKKK